MYFIISSILFGILGYFLGGYYGLLTGIIFGGLFEIYTEIRALDKKFKHHLQLKDEEEITEITE